MKFYQKGLEISQKCVKITLVLAKQGTFCQMLQRAASDKGPDLFWIIP